MNDTPPLVNQPSWVPTNKLVAVSIGEAVVALIAGLWSWFDGALPTEVIVPLGAIVPWALGYLVRDRASA